jgi:hypothetical protein
MCRFETLKFFRLTPSFHLNHPENPSRIFAQTFHFLICFPSLQAKHFLINPHKHIVSPDFNYNIAFLNKASFVLCSAHAWKHSFSAKGKQKEIPFHPNLRYYMHECTRLKEKQKDSEAMAESHNIL